MVATSARVTSPRTRCARPASTPVIAPAQRAPDPASRGSTSSASGSLVSSGRGSSSEAARPALTRLAAAASERGHGGSRVLRRGSRPNRWVVIPRPQCSACRATSLTEAPLPTSTRAMRSASVCSAGRRGLRRWSSLSRAEQDEERAGLNQISHRRHVTQPSAIGQDYWIATSQLSPHPTIVQELKCGIDLIGRRRGGPGRRLHQAPAGSARSPWLIHGRGRAAAARLITPGSKLCPKRVARSPPAGSNSATITGCEVGHTDASASTVVRAPGEPLKEAKRSDLSHSSPISPAPAGPVRPRPAAAVLATDAASKDGRRIETMAPSGTGP